MTQTIDNTPEIADSGRRRHDTTVITLVSVAHFMSHFYIMLLPPLFVFVRDEYQVSYTALGFAITVFNITSAALQTPAGFLVDALSPRMMLLGGLLIGAVTAALAGVVNSFPFLVVMFAISGVANTVYHPADYAILSRDISPERMSSAFSIHSFSGLFGGAVAPPMLLLIAEWAGWRGAFIFSAGLGAAAALLLLLQFGALRGSQAPKPAATPTNPNQPLGWRLLMTAPILCNLAFFIMLAMVSGGVQNFTIVALEDLHGTSIGVANNALTGFLLLSALGVLVGGRVARRVTSQESIAAVSLIGTGAAVLAVGLVDFHPILLITMMSIGGFFVGFSTPSRDLIVRSVTPPGSYGTVFGFVSMGFNIGGMIAPVVFGALMDHGQSRAVFVLVPVFCLAGILTLLIGRRKASEA